MNLRTISCVLAVFCAACTPEPQQPPTQAEVEAFVHQYADATRAGDVSKVMDMFSRDAGVSSAGAGMIFNGWDTIKKVTGETIADVRQIPIALGKMEVTPLGPDTVVAVFPMKLGKAPLWADGAGTIILKRTPEGLRILHEHYSLRDS